MRKIRASEIGTYLFCQRAWRYQQQGIETENLHELAAGQELHHRHGRMVLTSTLWRALGYLLLLCALILLAVHLTLQVI
ncbi:MAG: hypothetical protein D6803_07550 [Anaerolineae bacterium]|nr:MAG: hypothetical protein D6803_07550 [Anaerolineae bacterium]